MSEASDPAAGSSPAVGDPWSMTGEQATAALNQMSAALRPAPAPLVPSNANEARQRIAELKADPAFLKAYFDGSIDARRQIAALDQLIADATDADDALGGGQDTQQIEVIMGPWGLPRKDKVSTAADLRALWSDSDNCEAAIAEAFTAESVDADLLQNMQEWKAQALNDPAFVEMFMRGDRWATQRMTLANLVIGIGTP
jgi:hypothetical protein